MTTVPRTAAQLRTTGNRRATPASTGTPDPRPLTGFTVLVEDDAGSTRVTITLSQPCVIRAPNWAFISNTDGTRHYADSVTVVDNTTFYFDFIDGLSPKVGTIEVPYQDMQVQNFQGGFVVPGGTWFRAAS